SETDHARKAKELRGYCRAALLPCRGRIDTGASFPVKRTTDSNRSAADTGRKCAELRLRLAACSEKGRRSTFVRRHLNPGIRFHNGRASLHRTGRTDWRCGTVQSPARAIAEAASRETTSKRVALTSHRESRRGKCPLWSSVRGTKRGEMRSVWHWLLVEWRSSEQNLSTHPV